MKVNYSKLFLLQFPVKLLQIILRLNHLQYERMTIAQLDQKHGISKEIIEPVQHYCFPVQVTLSPNHSLSLITARDRAVVNYAREEQTR